MMQAIPLAGRYRFLKRLAAGPSRSVWLAEDATTGSMVIAVRLAARFARLLAPMIRVRHPHLACLVDIIREAPREELPEDEAKDPAGPIALADWVSGQTLYDALMRDPIPRHLAVQSVAGVVSAVAAAHAQNAFHGAISARSVVLERADDGPGPVLTQVIVPPDGSYASPERLSGAGPSQQDDAWALHVLLYVALTGQRPFRAKSREDLLRMMENPSPVPLDAFGIHDDALQQILDAGFRREESQRMTSVQTLEKALFDWLVAHGPDDTGRQTPVVSEAGEVHVSATDPRRDPDPGEVEEEEPSEAPTVMTPAPMQEVLAKLSAGGSPIETPVVTDAGLAYPASAVSEPRTSTEPSTEAVPVPEPAPAREPEPPEQPAPAPKPPPIAPATPTRRAQDSSRPSSRATPLVLGGIGLTAVLAAAAGGYLFVAKSETVVSASTGAPPARSATPVAVAPTATKSAEPAEPSPAPPSAAPPATVAAIPKDVSSCIAEHFTPETFAKPQDLTFVCEQPDPREGAMSMRVKIVRGSAGKLSEGMNMWPRLGWHEIAVYAMLRRKCCAGRPEVELPPPAEACPSLSGAVNALSSAYVTRPSELERPLEAFVAAATCAQNKRDRAYRYRSGPLSGGQVSFAEFLEVATK